MSSTPNFSASRVRLDTNRKEAQQAKLSAAPQRKIALRAKEPKEAGDVVSKSREEFARKRALDNFFDGEAKALETSLSGEERESRRKRYCAASRFMGGCLYLQPATNKHIFHSGSQICLGLWATLGSKNHISLEEPTRSSMPSAHFFVVQASLLHRVPCTSILVFCSRDTLLDRSRGPVPFDGPGETAGPHPVNVCEADAPGKRGGLAMDRTEICSLTASWRRQYTWPHTLCPILWQF